MGKKGSFRDQLRTQGKKDLGKQQKDQRKSKDQKGRYPTIFKEDKFPPERERYDLQGDGDHPVDLIPFLAGKHHPTVEKGKIAYVVDFYVHEKVGKSQETIVCRWNTYGEPCAICEFIKSGFLNKKIYTVIKHKRRNAYLVWSHKNRDEKKKGIQIMECANYYMEKYIGELAKRKPGGGTYDFSDMSKKGYSFTFSKKGKGIDTEFIGHQFFRRKKSVPHEIIEQSFSLDEVIKLDLKERKIRKMFEPTIKSLLEWNSKLEKEEKGSSSDSSSDDSEYTSKKRKKDKKKKDKKKKDKKKRDKPKKKDKDKKKDKKKGSKKHDDVPF